MIFYLLQSIIIFIYTPNISSPNPASKFTMNSVNDIGLSSMRSSTNVYCVYLQIDHVVCLMPQLPSSMLVAIDFVNEWLHLSHVISTSGDDMHDISSRKSSPIGKINSILCNFRNFTCNTKIRLIGTYVQVSMEQNYGTYPMAILIHSASLGDEVLESCGICQTLVATTWNQ